LTPENAKTQELGHEDCPAANSRSTGPPTAKHPTTITVQSIWRTTMLTGDGGVFVCNFPLCTAELFHEDIGTPARRVWIVLGRIKFRVLSLNTS